MDGTRLFERVIVGNHYEWRALPASGGAAVSPVISSPAARTVASSHRTDARSNPRRPLITPLGTTSRFSV